MHCTKIVIICKNCEDYQFTGEGDPGIYEESNEQPTLKTIQSANIYQLGRCYTKARLCINASVVVIVGITRSKITIRSFQISQDYLCHRRARCCSDA